MYDEQWNEHIARRRIVYAGHTMQFEISALFWSSKKYTRIVLLVLIARFFSRDQKKRDRREAVTDAHAKYAMNFAKMKSKQTHLLVRLHCVGIVICRKARWLIFSTLMYSLQFFYLLPSFFRECLFYWWSYCGK